MLNQAKRQDYVKGLLSFLLCLVMLLSLFPATVFAEGNDGDGQNQMEAQKDPADDSAGESQDGQSMTEENGQPEENQAGQENLANVTTDEPGQDPDETVGEQSDPEAAGEDAAKEEAPKEDAQPVRVVFVCDPKETVITVYDTVIDENGQPAPALDQDGEALVILPETEGVYTLMPGVWLYDAECAGYESLEKAELIVKAPAEGETEQTVSVELKELQITRETKDATRGWATWTTTGNPAQDIVNCAVAQKGKTGSELGASGAWCAWFIWTCARKVGIGADVIPQNNYASIGERIIDAGGSRVTSSQAIPGDIVCFTSLTSDGKVSYNHVGIIIDNNLTTISGNLSDQVYRATVAQVCSWNSWSVDMVRYYRPSYSDPVDPVAANTVTSSDGLHTYVRYDNVSYTWTQAEAYCESLGGHLATITNSTEQNLVLNSVLSGCAKNIYFLGGTDANGSWRWLTGESFSYTYWDQTKPEPTNADGEDYAAIMGKDVGDNKQAGEWIDIFNEGDSRYNGFHLSDCGFICEYDYVAFNANGGSGAPQKQAKPLGTLTLTTAKPTRSGSSAGSYTVTLNANGGSVSQSSLTAARTTNYTFKNWNTAANGSGTSYASGASYTGGAATLYAQWDSSTITAAVTLPTPTRSGYTFKGWSTSSSASSGVTGSYTPTGNVTLYATWQANTYTVSYNANGGTGAPAAQTKTHDVALTLSTETPSRADESAGSWTVTLDPNGGSVDTGSMTSARTLSYTFNNWNTAADGSGTSYAPGGSYTANAAVTLYAQWNSSTSTAAVDLPTPSYADHTFKGWAASVGASSGVTGSYTPSGNVTLYAIWEADSVEPDPDQPTFRVSSASGRPGETVTLTVSMENNPGIAGFELSILYNASVLQWTGIAQGEFTGNWDLGVGEAVTWIDADNLTDDCDIFTLEFLILDEAEDGDYTVNLSYDEDNVFDEDGNNVSFAISAGKVTVFSRVPGDINGDDKVNNKDVLWLLRYVKGKVTTVVEGSTDINGDGKTNNKDVLWLLKYVKYHNVVIH